MVDTTFIHIDFLDHVDNCDRVIEYFNNHPNRTPGRLGGDRVDPSIKDSTDLSCRYEDFYNVYCLNVWMTDFRKCIDAYRQKYPACEQTLAVWGFRENINIQHYAPGQGYHGIHCERSFPGEPGIYRQLAFMTYLNDVTDGGETEWIHQELKIQPKRGMTVIWPSDWTHIHRGIVSPSQEKYIITGWLSFI